MSKKSTSSQSDLAIRHFVYRQIVANSVPPTVDDIMQHFEITEKKAISAYQRLNDAHFFFLEPNSHQIRMANPFSAIPTKFIVHVGAKTYWANCAWDMLGIPAALQKDAVIETAYEDTNQPVTLQISDGHLRDETGVVHFPLPVQQWYDDLILT